MVLETMLLTDICAGSLILGQKAERRVIKPLAALYFVEIKEEPEIVSWTSSEYQSMYFKGAQRPGDIVSHLLSRSPINLPLEKETPWQEIFPKQNRRY